jgi:GT2 family glycosyltransferase
MKVSVIVVSHSRRDLLEKCLQSLFLQDYPWVEVVVVDNGSQDDTLEWLQRQDRPGLKVVRLDRNLGFTGGNIQGLRAAEGEAIALVNNDAWLEPDWVSKMVAGLEKDPEVGSCACRILDGANPAVLDSAGHMLVTSSRIFERGKGRPAEAFDQEAYVFGPSGAAALYRREMLAEVGFLDEAFFFNCEDVDLSFRAQLCGWKCLYVPSAVARHLGNASHEVLGHRATFLWSRNSELVWLKNMPKGLLWRYLHHKVLQEFASFLKIAFKGSRPLAFLGGKLAVLPMLPGILRERGRVQGGRKLRSRGLRPVTVSYYWWERELFMLKLRRMGLWGSREASVPRTKTAP